MTTASSRRWIAFLAAAVVLLAGFFVALVVLEPRACGMDDFDCYGSENIYRYLTGFASVLLACVLVALGLATHDD
jgi:uncharacterized membrane protein